MRSAKRVLCLLLMAAMLMSFAPLSIQVHAEETEGYYTYTVTDDEVTITDVDTAISGDVTIPSTLGGYPVTGIGENAFCDCHDLISVTIPDSVTSIGDWTFSNCHNLNNITIPDSVTSIGEGAFALCYSLTNITIPDSVTSIGDSAFDVCEGLVSVIIGNGVTSIGIGPFENCSSLTGIWVSEDNANYCNDSYGVLFDKNKTTLIQAPCKISGVYTVPDSVNSIEARAFSGCHDLTGVTIGKAVTSIGYLAFSFCYSLTSVTIPDSVTSIGECAFASCTNLQTVYYGGTETKWNAIIIDDFGNDELLNTTIVYAESSNPDEEFGITYEQLFTLYPDYLYPQQETAVINSLMDAYLLVLEDYGGIYDFLPSFIYTLDEGGSDIIATEILALFGLAESTEEKLIADTTEALMREILQSEDALTTVIDDIADDFSTMKNIYDITTVAGKYLFVEDLKEACTNLSDADVEKITFKLFESGDDIMKGASEGVELWQLIAGIIELQEMQEESICRLRDALEDNSDLAKALGELLVDIEKDIVNHVIEQYTSKKVIELLSKAVQTVLADGIESELGLVHPGKLAQAIGKLVIKFVTKVIYPGAMADEVCQTTLLSEYVSEFNAAIDSHRTQFLLAKSKGETVEQADIAEYEYLYSAFITTLHEALENTLSIAKTDIQEANIENAISICEKFTYEKYIEWCIAAVESDIAAGIIAAPGDIADSETNSDDIPVGAYDGAIGGVESVYIHGWAFDPDTLDKSVEIYVYVDGRFISSFPANTLRTDVNSAHGCGDYHGFAISLPVSVTSTGTHSVHLYAFNTTLGETNLDMGSKEVTVTAHTHSYVEGVTKEPSKTATGEKVCTCSVCGDSYTETLPALFYGANTDMGNSLDLNFYFFKELVDSTGYVKIVREFADGTKETTTKSLAEFGFNGDFYQITFPGLAAMEMNDKVHMTVYDKDGNAISETKTESLCSYIRRALDQITDKTARKMYVDMLNYGAAAQQNFNYNTGNLANSILTDDEKAEGTQTTEALTNGYSRENTSYYGTNFDLESSINLNLYVLASAIGENGYAQISYINFKGEEVTKTVTEYTVNGDYYVFTPDFVVAADGRCLLDIRFCKADGTQVVSVTDSMESYVARAIEKNPEKYGWMEKLIAYSDSARTYLQSK